MMDVQGVRQIVLDSIVLAGAIEQGLYENV